MEPFEVETLLTRKQIRRLYIAIFFAKTSSKIYCAVLIATALVFGYIVVTWLVYGAPIRNGLWVGIAALLFSTLYTIFYMRQQAAQVTLEPIRYRFTEERIFITANDVNEDLGWSRILKSARKAGMLLLYISKAQFYILPLNVLTEKQAITIEEKIMTTILPSVA